MEDEYARNLRHWRFSLCNVFTKTKLTTESQRTQRKPNGIQCILCVLCDSVLLIPRFLLEEQEFSRGVQNSQGARVRDPGLWNTTVASGSSSCRLPAPTTCTTGTTLRLWQAYYLNYCNRPNACGRLPCGFLLWEW